MYIEFSDRVNDPSAPCGGLVIKSFTNWTFEKILPVIMTKLRHNEQMVLQPGMIIQIAQLSFIVERFNTGIVSKIGNNLNVRYKGKVVNLKTVKGKKYTFGKESFK